MVSSSLVAEVGQFFHHQPATFGNMLPHACWKMHLRTVFIFRPWYQGVGCWLLRARRDWVQFLFRIKEAFQKSVVRFDYSVPVFWQEHHRTSLLNQNEKHKWETAYCGPSVCKRQIYTRDDPLKQTKHWLRHYFQPYLRYMHACAHDIDMSRCRHLDDLDDYDFASVNVYKKCRRLWKIAIPNR